MHTLYAEFTALPGHAPHVRRLITDYGRIVRQEPGNVAFEVYEKDGQEGAFFVFEKYVNDDAFEEHLKGASGTKFNSALAPKIVGGSSTLIRIRDLS